MRFSAYDTGGELLRSRTCYSVGGGFVVDEPAEGQPPDAGAGTEDSTEDGGLPCPFASAAELLDWCTESGLPVSGVMLANETDRRPAGEVRARLLAIWAVMRQCVASGCETPGI